MFDYSAPHKMVCDSKMTGMKFGTWGSSATHMGYLCGLSVSISAWYIYFSPFLIKVSPLNIISRSPAMHSCHNLVLSGKWTNRESRPMGLLLGGGIRLIVGFQPLMVISPTASWILWRMQVYAW